MIELLILALAFLVSVSFFLWKVAKFEWLDKICGLLILSFPFERIPTLDIGGSSLKIGQLLVVLGLWVFLILFFKKDENILQLKINKINWLFLLFIVFGIPSAFFVIDSKRFLVTLLATYLCFGGAFLISNFALDIFTKLRNLVTVMVFTSIFGLYQFVGDLAGLPITLTGLREQYTKIVFGIPRIQATANEPLYFAGMLFFPLMYLLVNILAKHKVKIPFFKQFSTTNLLLFFILVFVLTISKGAFVILALVILLLLYVTRNKLDSILLIKKITNFLISAFTIIGVAALFSNNFLNIITNFVDNFIQTITFQFASSIDRLNFVQVALQILPANIVLGIGSGQYGAWVNQYNLIVNPDPTNYLIVNNVYLEVWLEFGLLSVLTFIIFLFYPIWKNFKILNLAENWKTPNNICRLVVIFALISYYLQWFTFSPIFIMPIFILLGIAANLSENPE
jgi:O-antigen ligase